MVVEVGCKQDAVCCLQHDLWAHAAGPRGHSHVGGVVGGHRGGTGRGAGGRQRGGVNSTTGEDTATQRHWRGHIILRKTETLLYFVNEDSMLEKNRVDSIKRFPQTAS